MNFSKVLDSAPPEAKAGLPVHEQVYRRLRDRVLFGDLRPGQAVTIQGLVEDLGAGMTPVREALRRLTTEGALQALGNRRIVVPVLDAAQLDELLLGRLALEPMLAGRAAERMENQVLEALTQIDTALDRAIAQGDVPGYLACNHAFHARINAMAGAPLLAGMVEALWLRFGPSTRVVCGQFGTRNLPDLHKDILSAFAARDAAAAARAMAADVTQGVDLVRASL